MSVMSKKYGLSKRYTNHCLRVTSIQTMDDANVDTRHIMRIRGHKCASSVEAYAQRLNTSKKRKISNVLTEHLKPVDDEPCSSRDDHQVT